SEQGGQSDWENAGFVKGNGNSYTPKEYSFADNISKVRFAGKVQYRLKQIDNDGSFTYSDVTEVEITAPKEFILYNNYPNPFNPETVIEFTVPENGMAKLKVFNITGEEVATLFNGFAEAGKYYKISFNAVSLAAGIYFTRLQYGSNAITKKMTYLK
ncbi:MAG: T9SS type A sorting domain-containing protein, partial [Ignavibacteriaceae bacterium]